MADRVVRFQIGSDNHDYLVDELMVRLESEGSEYTYLDDSVEVEVRRLRLKFDLKGVFEAADGDPHTAGELWFEFLKGSEITFFPNGTSGPSTRVIPDIRHSPTLLAFKQGMRRRRNSLRFVENDWRGPSDTHFNDFQTLITNL